MASDRISARKNIEKLVNFFDENIYQFKSSSFNETQARQQLIDPFFEALGWDVHNRLMQPLFRQEVVPESRMKSSTAREVKEQEPLFPKKETLGKEYKEYASILDYIAEDEYKANSKEAVKKPDYRFRIGGQTKFFVEAKKPYVDLVKSQSAIFQVKRYGFSGRVPLAILTDFEEFRTFDCTQRPAFEKPKLGIIKDFDLTYQQYLDHFERLYETFSREAVAGGSLEALTKKMMLKRTGDFALDREFLEDLSKWREELARDIAKHPKNRRLLNDYTLNEAVQRILDRIVFIRVCEDREIEVENTLLAILRMWKERPGSSLYSLLNDLFKQRRALYNGLLFSPHPCEELEIGNEVLIKILENLNYPFSPYHFNEIGVEILGSIYEKFLGKTIHLAPKNVIIKDKSEVRKAGGVYYTPQYIVKYIVDNTLGKLLYEDGEKRSPLLIGEGQGEVPKAKPTLEPPVVGGKELRSLHSQASGSLIEGQLDRRKLKLSSKQVAKLKIIDIACGSGSFLLGAFQKLIDYHIEWYTAHPEDIKTENNVPDACKDADGNYHLSPRKKRDILVNNIYGVDIDRQAVEVTQMSLYLKVLEGENAETLNPQMTLALKEVYLPSLAKNIKCGNSLIGTDFTSQGEMFDEEARHKVNPFDWEMEFPEILGTPPSPPLIGEGKGEVQKGGVQGFDVVIGNPPYIRIQTLQEVNPSWIEYLGSKYQTAQTKNFDIFVNFVEKGRSLLSKKGMLGYILPNKFMQQEYGESLRRIIVEERLLKSLVNFKDQQVFEGATTYTCLLFLTKSREEYFNYTEVIDLAEFASKEFGIRSSSMLHSSITKSPWILSGGDEGKIFLKLAKNPKLEEIANEIFVGLQTSADKILILEKKKELSKNRIQLYSVAKRKEYNFETQIAKPIISGVDVKRYITPEKRQFIIFPYKIENEESNLYPEKILEEKYPLTLSYLLDNKKELQARERGKFKDKEWYRFGRNQNIAKQNQKKLCVPRLVQRIQAVYDGAGEYYLDNVDVGGLTLKSNSDDNYKFILGLLNSKLQTFYLRLISTHFRGGYYSCNKQYLSQLPIRTIDFNNPAEKKMHDDLVSLVEKMLELNKQLQKAHFDSEKEPIERQIAATDKKIDDIVYALYGLTPEEIAIVEGKNNK